MSFENLVIDINARVAEFINTMEKTTPEMLGLDPRSAGTVYVSKDTIAVRDGWKKSLRYYGGFEYVDEEDERQLGDYVFYSANDSRVKNHINRFYGIEEEETEGDW